MKCIWCILCIWCIRYVMKIKAIKTAFYRFQDDIIIIAHVSLIGVAAFVSSIHNYFKLISRHEKWIISTFPYHIIHHIQMNLQEEVGTLTTNINLRYVWLLMALRHNVSLCVRAYVRCFMGDCQYCCDLFWQRTPPAISFMWSKNHVKSARQTNSIFESFLCCFFCPSLLPFNVLHYPSTKL